MNRSILSKTFQNNEFFFENLNGQVYLNATKTAKVFNKRLDNWRASNETSEYIEILTRSLNISERDLIVVRQGGKPQEQGTWLHPKLVIFFARWVSPEFAVWCDMTIEEILKSKPHQTVQVQNETFDIKLYTQQSREMIELTQLINSQNSKTLYYLDNLYKSLNIQSPLELLKINLENYYFIPTELGNFINASPVETNKILEFKGFQTKQNGIWVLTEKGRDFAIEVQNGSFLQIKWKLKAISE